MNALDATSRICENCGAHVDDTGTAATDGGPWRAYCNDTCYHQHAGTPLLAFTITPNDGRHPASPEVV